MGGYMGKAWEKLFCHHQYEEKQRIEMKDKLGNVVAIKTLYICKVCGKVKSTEI